MNKKVTKASTKAARTNAQKALDGLPSQPPNKLDKQLTRLADDVVRLSDALDTAKGWTHD